MAMAYRASAAAGSAVGASASASLTTALGDLIFILTIETGVTSPASTVSDSVGGSYSQVAFKSFVTGVVQLWVRTTLFTLADLAGTSVQFTNAPTSGATGNEIVALAVSGFGAADGANSATPLGAIRQQVTAAVTAGVAPTTSFGAVALTGNLTLSVVGCLTNPPGLNPPASWTTRNSVGQSTPVGLQVVTRDSGFTGTAITWGSNSPSTGAVISIELDGNARAPTYQNTNPPTVVVQKGVACWIANRQQYVMPQRPRRESSMLCIPANQNTAKTITVVMRGIGSDTGIAGLAASLVVLLKKAGGAYATITPAITDRGGGAYDIALTAAHLDTLGVAALRVYLVTALPGIEMVITNDDVLIDVVVSYSTGDVNVVSWLGTSVPAPTVAGVPMVETVSIGADAITAAAIATDAIDADALASDAITEIQAGLATSVDVTAAVTAINAHTDADVAPLATSANVTAAVTAINANTDADVAPLATSADVSAAETAINAHTDAAVAPLATSVDVTNAVAAINANTDAQAITIMSLWYTPMGTVATTTATPIQALRRLYVLALCPRAEGIAPTSLHEEDYGQDNVTKVIDTVLNLGGTRTIVVTDPDP